jgi:hypothetical protein
MIKLKRILALVTVMLLIFTACTKLNVSEVSTSLENLTTVKTTVGTDKDLTSNYQGYINIKTNMSEANVKSLKQVTVKKITFGKNDNGTAVMYRYNPEFDQNTVKVIYNETKRGNVSDTFAYTPDMFGNFGFQKTAEGEYTTKIQYLIMQVNPGVKPEDVRRNVTFTMVYEFNKGKPVEKSINVNIP